MWTAALALALAPSFAQQDSQGGDWPALSYTLLQVEYAELNAQGFSTNPDGFIVSGSVALTDVVHLFGGYTWATGRAAGAGVDTESYTLGLGAHLSLGPRVDLVGELGWVDTTARTSGASTDDDGPRVAAALRTWVSREVELELGLARVDLDRAGADTSVFFGGVLHVAEHVGLVGNLSVGDDVDVASVGLRLFR